MNKTLNKKQAEELMDALREIISHHSGGITSIHIDYESFCPQARIEVNSRKDGSGQSHFSTMEMMVFIVDIPQMNQE